MKKGDIVQFKSDWGKEATVENTSLILRTAKDGSWADVETPYCTKRIKNPEKHLKVVEVPIVVYVDD